MRKYSIICSVFFICLCSIPVFTVAQNTTDKINIEGKEYGIHKVAAGETLYSIARKYGIDITELIIVNRIGENGYTINVNDLLVIPFYAIEAKVPAEPAIVDTGQYLVHIVKQGETLYSIARNYTGISPAMIKSSNKLQNDTLHIDQKIIIPQKINNKAIYEPVGKAVDNPAMVAKPLKTAKEEKKEEKVKEVEANEDYFEKLQANLKIQFENADSAKGRLEVSRGIGTWLDNDRSENKKNFYALHKYAPIGTVLKVRNLMNNKIVYVKVIGKLPENDENKNYIIKISGAAARYLNILDERFLVELLLPAPKS